MNFSVALPERVEVQLPIAGVGSRSLAHLIDLSLVFGIVLVAYFVASLAFDDLYFQLRGLRPVLQLALALGTFFLVWGWWTTQELLWKGQTIGKRLLRLRVVRLDGGLVSATGSAVRNLVRIIDFFPICYGVGLLTMLIDRHHRRLGDLVAGTLCVHDLQVDLGRYALDSPTAQLTSVDIELVTSFLERAPFLDGSARDTLGRQLAARMGLGIPANATSAEIELALGTHIGARRG